MCVNGLVAVNLKNHRKTFFLVATFQGRGDKIGFSRCSVSVIPS